MNTVYYKCVFVFLLFVNLISHSQELINNEDSTSNIELLNIYTSKTYTKLEVLKIYNNQTYEQVRYKYKRGESYVKINSGKYLKRNNRLVLLKPSHREFGSYLVNKSLYVSKHIYLEKKDAYLHRSHPFYRTQSISYNTPFCINPENISLAVYDGKINISLEEISDYITKGLHSDFDKVMAISKFIHKNIEYDYNALSEKKDIIHIQDSTSEILLSNFKVATCAGYSHMFNELANYAGVNSKKVIGYTKTSHSAINNSIGYHAWNKVWIDGKAKLYDFTWADDNDSTWLDVSPEIMLFTHFPNNKADQLLENPISKEEWLKMPVYLPKQKHEKLLCNFKNGITYFDDYIQITVPVDHNVNISSMNDNYLYSYYWGEKHEKLNWNIGNESIEVIEIKKTSDSVTYSFTLDKEVSLIEMRISKDNYYSSLAKIDFIAVKGDFNNYLEFLAQKSNNVLIEPMLLGIISALYLNDNESLKKLVSDTCKILFDENGDLKLDEKIINEIKKWKGDRYICRYYSFDGNPNKVYMTNVTNKLKIYIEKLEGQDEFILKDIKYSDGNDFNWLSIDSR